jgi:hypothetical protein
VGGRHRTFLTVPKYHCRCLNIGGSMEGCNVVQPRTLTIDSPVWQARWNGAFIFGGTNMAGNHPPPGKRGKEKKGNAVEFRFINHSFSVEDVRWLEAADLGVEFPLASAFDLVAEGYKLGFSADAKNHTFVCSLTDRSEGSVFFNACLTGRGATPLDAWYALAYRHFQLSQEDWKFFGDSGDASPTTWG